MNYNNIEILMCQAKKGNNKAKEKIAEEWEIENLDAISDSSEEVFNNIFVNDLLNTMKSNLSQSEKETLTVLSTKK